jgi:hypothetical protein
MELRAADDQPSRTALAGAVADVIDEPYPMLGEPVRSFVNRYGGCS